MMHCACDVAEALVKLTILEIEMRGRVPADICREAREKLARAVTAGNAQREHDALMEARAVIEARGGCHHCSDERTCAPCLDGREAAGLC